MEDRRKEMSYMIDIPDDLAYTEEHEWVRDEGEFVRIGITDFAQEHLGDIVFVEMEPVGTKVQKGGKIGVVESVKSASDVYSPVSGEIVEVNDALADAPEVVNESPYLDGWMVIIKADDKGEIDDLMDQEKYKAHCAKGPDH